MHLFDLPEDVLARILDGETSPIALTLWKTGCPALLARLSNGGVRNLELQCIYRVKVMTWPRCVKEFKLHHLSIKGKKSTDLPVHLLQNELKCLHRGLRTLVIHSSSACDAIFTPSSQTLVSTDANSDAQPSNDHPTEASLNATEWDLNDTFDALETLKLFGEESRIFHLTARALARLPRSLSRLALYGNAHLFEGARFETSLPKLQRFTTSEILPFNLALLPQHVTRLGGQFLDIPQLQELASVFPTILPKLQNISCVPVPVDNAGNSPLQASNGNWPSYIKAMMLKTQGRAPTTLPPSLTLLRIADYDLALDNDFIKVLPSTLTSLDVSTIDWSVLDPILWPSLLTSLSCARSNHFGPHSFSNLPRTLLSLNTGADGRTSRALDTEYPLKAGLSLIAGADRHLWSTLKMKLIEDGKRDGGRLESKITAYIAAVERGELFGLPLTLTNLRSSDLNIDVGVNLLLPPRLELISFKLAPFAQTSIFWHLLPPSLHTLSAFGLQSNHGSEWEVLSVPIPSQSTLYQQNSLRSLTIFFTDVYSKHHLFEYLPRSLSQLVTAVGDPIYADKLRELPPYLTSLNLMTNTNKIVPEESWATHLPKGLQRLFCGAPLYGSDIKNLPRNLDTIYCSLARTTIDDLLTAPRSLRVLTPVRNDTLIPDDPTHLNMDHLYRLSAAFFPFYRIFALDKASLAAIISS